MEGPFISMAKKGAQNGKYIHKPDVAMFERLQEAAGGLFKLVDLAPEEEGAMEFIRAEKEKSCCRSHIQQRIMRQQKQRSKQVSLI